MKIDIGGRFTAYVINGLTSKRYCAYQNLSSYERRAFTQPPLKRCSNFDLGCNWGKFSGEGPTITGHCARFIVRPYNRNIRPESWIIRYSWTYILDGLAEHSDNPSVDAPVTEQKTGADPC